MINNYSYRLDKSLVGKLQDIERLMTELHAQKVQPAIEKIRRQKSILKSSVFSARIEGNPNTPGRVSMASVKNNQTQDKKELGNLFKALSWVVDRSWRQSVNLSDIKKLHLLVLKELKPDAGQLRDEVSAIFNQAGVAIYVCPPPQEIPGLVSEWLDYVNNEKEPIIPIKAAVSHFVFEKIHPFMDGNGRVGRLLIHVVLKKFGYDMRGLVPFEEYLDENRQEYYDLLNLKGNDITAFVEFFLLAIATGLRRSVEARQNEPGEVLIEDSLPLRRHEILQIIRDHGQVSFNFVKRRFMKVSDRLLQYDLKKLRDVGLIKKRGVTKGVIYEPV